MKEELGQLDADLKGLFVEEKLEEMIEMLGEQPISVVSEISEHNWNITKKYYDNQQYELLMKHLKFVAYTCFIVEYAHQAGVIKQEEFDSRMATYNEIYELVRQ